MPEPLLDVNSDRDRDISQTEKLRMLKYLRDAKSQRCAVCGVPKVNTEGHYRSIFQSSQSNLVRDYNTLPPDRKQYAKTMLVNLRLLCGTDLSIFGGMQHAAGQPP